MRLVKNRIKPEKTTFSVSSDNDIASKVNMDNNLYILATFPNVYVTHYIFFFVYMQNI